MPNPAPVFSVVMPSYQNATTLIPSVRSFLEQTTLRHQIELIVVDDEPVPHANALLSAANLTNEVRLLETGHRGQVEATNLGINAATGEFIFLTCADIIATPTLLERHLRLHQNTSDLYCVTGPIHYPTKYNTTPFIKYLVQSGRQFRFPSSAQLNNEGVTTIPPQQIYAPHISLPRSTLQACGGFDTAFTYGFQDADLGLRLQQSHDMHFIYDAQAHTTHEHPTTIEQYARREFQMGVSLPIFRRRYPTLTASHSAPKRDIENLRKSAPHFASLSTRIADTVALEKTLLQTPSVDGYKTLFLSYDVILDLSRLAGLASQVDALIGLYEFEHPEAQALAAAARCVSPSV